MLPQVPSVPLPFFAARQDWQVDVQVLLQQTPSVQMPLVHSPFCVQATPFVRSAQVPDPLQETAPVHSLSGSFPERMLSQTPSTPAPFFAAVHA